MPDERATSISALDDLLKKIESVRVSLRKNKVNQIRNTKDKSNIKTVSDTWFKNCQNTLPEPAVKWEIVTQINSSIKTLDGWTYYSTSRDKYLAQLKIIKASLIQLRSIVISDTKQILPRKSTITVDKLITDVSMQQIIYRRWDEIEQCVNIAPLSCVVMIGALLEALILARINKLDNKSEIFKLKSTPQDRKTGKPLDLKEWTLSNYIEVSSEMGWIRKPAKDVSTTIMEYRNLIHPEKQWRLGVILEPQDSRMFYAIFKELSNQIIESI